MLFVLAQAGQPTGPQFSQWAQYIWPILFIAFTLLGWVFRIVSQKRTQSKALAERRRREEEMLRTGRSEDGRPISHTPALAPVPDRAPPASAEDARRRLQELAQRRRAELQQMAERARRGGGAAGAPPVRPSPVRPVPSAGSLPTARPAAGPAFPPASRPATPGPTLQRPGDAQRRAAQQQKAAKARAAAEQARNKAETERQRAQAAAARAAAAAAKAAPPTAYSMAEFTHATHATHGPLGVPPQPLPGARKGLVLLPSLHSGPREAVIEEVRRAFVLSEVLARPLSMREGPVQ